MRGTFGVRVRLGLVQELQKAVLSVGAQCAVKGAEQHESERLYVYGFAKLAALEVQLREAVLQQPSIAEVLASGAGVRRNPSVVRQEVVGRRMRTRTRALTRNAYVKMPSVGPRA